MMRANARKKIDGTALSERTIRKVPRSLFPPRHDYGDGSIAELLPELDRFGIATTKSFRLLMKKHRRALIEDDGERLPRAVMIGMKDDGWQGLDLHSNLAWLALPGLVRGAMQYEFGEAAVVVIHPSEA